MSQNELDRQERERQERFNRALKDTSIQHENKIKCWSCGMSVPEDYKYCSYCGNPPDEKENPNTDDWGCIGFGFFAINAVGLLIGLVVVIVYVSRCVFIEG